MARRNDRPYFIIVIGASTTFVPMQHRHRDDVLMRRFPTVGMSSKRLTTFGTTMEFETSADRARRWRKVDFGVYPASP